VAPNSLLHPSSRSGVLKLWRRDQPVGGSRDRRQWSCDGVAESGPVMGCRQPQRLAPAVVALASMYSNIWQIRVGPKSGNCRQFVLDIRAGRASIPREFALASACGTKWMGISL
jgi:hypothetical protein